MPCHLQLSLLVSTCILEDLANMSSICTAVLPQIPSDKVVFNEKPDMKANEITAAGIEALKSGKYKMVSLGRQAGRHNSIFGSRATCTRVHTLIPSYSLRPI